MLEFNESMDLQGVPCPQNFARVVLRLEAMDEGERLEVFIDDGEPIDNVPLAVLDKGHRIKVKEKVGDMWRLIIEKRDK